MTDIKKPRFVASMSTATKIFIDKKQKNKSRRVLKQKLKQELNRLFS